MDAEDTDEALALLQLNLTPGVGVRLQSLLLARFVTASEIFKARRDELLGVAGIGPKVVAALADGRDFSQARLELENCRSQATTLIWRNSVSYPALLREIFDPPPILYVQGNLVEQDRMSIGIVGSRNCSHYGRSTAQKFARQLAERGVTVISGLARGIDAAAHTGAMEGGGRTLAVCASGFNHIYPPEHEQLAKSIVGQGALVTESPLDRAPQKGLFPQRNRVIAGLSLGVLIVEASRTSGSLHTARHAMEQGREVFAVPGRIDLSNSDGCHDLIRDGATLVRNVDDLLESLGPIVKPVVTPEGRTVAVPRELNLNDLEQSILSLVDFAPVTIDSVIGRAEIASSRVLSTLTVLEMKRLIRRMPGGQVERITG